MLKQMGIDYLENLVNQTFKAGKSTEGSADDDEQKFLASLAERPAVRRIGEIGFNAGLSSYSFLAANPNVTVYSFDLGEYDYVRPAKNHIDKQFPDRHHLIIGNSLETVPHFARDNPGLKFDLIFIDGGHDYEVAKADLLNMRKLAHWDTILVIDDLTPWKPWGIGPTKAWTELIEQSIVTQQELYKDGRSVDTISPPGDRSWAVGRYVMTKTV